MNRICRSFGHLALVLLFSSSEAFSAPSYHSLVREYTRLERVDSAFKTLESLAERVSPLTLSSAYSSSQRAKLLEILAKTSKRSFLLSGDPLVLGRALKAFRLAELQAPSSDTRAEMLFHFAQLLSFLPDTEDIESYLYDSFIENYPNHRRATEVKRLLEALPKANFANFERSEQLEMLRAGAVVAYVSESYSRALGEGWDRLSTDEKPGKSRRILVAIDPGHGGEELGAVGVDGLLEKDVVLSISKKLDYYFRRELRISTVMTRSTDVNVLLGKRAEIANEQNADLFLSIHANAVAQGRARGIETYYLDNTNDRASLRLAKLENASWGGESLDDLDFIISDLIQTGKQVDSISLAHFIQSSLVKTLAEDYSNIRDLGVKRAPFYVLVGAHMPCVLLEVAFIDHPVEGRRLATPEFQSAVARAVVLGVRDYFASDQD